MIPDQGSPQFASIVTYAIVVSSISSETAFSSAPASDGRFDHTQFTRKSASMSVIGISNSICRSFLPCPPTQKFGCRRACGHDCSPGRKCAGTILRCRPGQINRDKA